MVKSISTVTVKKNAYTNVKYSKVESADYSDTWGDVKLCLLDAKYSGKKLILSLALYNKGYYTTGKFRNFVIKVYYNDKKIKTYKIKKVSGKLKPFKKMKFTAEISMSKVYDLVNAKDFYIEYEFEDTMYY